jgi:hypothetical protein
MAVLYELLAGGGGVQSGVRTPAETEPQPA